ncbi:MAG: MotA/TolQ/ExbB proton channel family protein [Rhizobacter sp.]|nr:MotA/TolQ/ExbB proton channel family protein [Chlorobiales bacterium]
MGVGILFFFTVLPGVELAPLKLLYTAGPLVGLQLGLLMLLFFNVCLEFFVPLTVDADREKFLNRLNALTTLPIYVGATGLMVGLFRIFAEASRQAVAGIDWDKFYAAVAEAILNPVVGLVVALLAKICYHYFKGRYLDAAK